jgi:poly-gamma-glutamate capsule biosynthesis protein CapA/YwtB (metallophosphatase superfamily)
LEFIINMQSTKQTIWVLLLLLVAGCGSGRPVPGVLVQHAVNFAPPAPPAPPTVHMVFVGDLMLDRTPGRAMAQGEDPFASFAAVLQQSDLTVGNLEVVIASGGKKVPKAYNFLATPQVIPLVARYFSAVSVANNHSGDYGKEAFAEELTLLKQGGLPYFGGGHNSEEAHSPLVLERNGLRVALLGYSEIELRSFEAGPETPGVAWSDDAQVVADIRAAQAVADLVLVYAHWGVEYQAVPSARQQALAHLMVDAGADLVVGAHPHVVQPVERYKGGLIVYSLGNFVFDDFKDVTPDRNEPSRTSWVLRVTAGRDGVLSWDTLVARTDDTGFPRHVPGATSPCQVGGVTATCLSN